MQSADRQVAEVRTSMAVTPASRGTEGLQTRRWREPDPTHRFRRPPSNRNTARTRAGPAATPGAFRGTESGFLPRRVLCEPDFQCREDPSAGPSSMVTRLEGKTSQ